MQNSEDKISEKKGYKLEKRGRLQNFCLNLWLVFWRSLKKSFSRNFEYLLLLKCVSTERCQCTFVILKTLHIYMLNCQDILYTSAYILYFYHPLLPLIQAAKLKMGKIPFQRMWRMYFIVHCQYLCIKITIPTSEYIQYIHVLLLVLSSVFLAVQLISNCIMSFCAGIFTLLKISI